MGIRGGNVVMRLTKKNIGMVATIDASEKVKKEVAIFNKLHALEDVEEELGIDLITFFKALKNGVWIYDTNGIKMFTGHFQNGLVFNYCSQPSIQYGDRLFYINDYGKTWALTKEELL